LHSWKVCERLLGAFRALADKPLDEIKHSDLVRVLDQMIASGTPYRANRALSALKKLMAWVLDRGMIEVNPSPFVQKGSYERQFLRSP
jgi:site-specific recombinase XerD